MSKGDTSSTSAGLADPISIFRQAWKALEPLVTGSCLSIIDDD